jgi:N-terminal half of MaoC dehydratase
MIDFDHSLIGRRFETATPVEITAEMIASFCAMMKETNSVYVSSHDGEHEPRMAPPALVATFRALEDIFDYLPRHVPRLAAGMDVEFGQPIRAGDAISISSQLAETYAKTGRSGAMTFFVIRSTLTNQRGGIVARIDHRFTYRG